MLTFLNDFSVHHTEVVNDNENKGLGSYLSWVVTSPVVFGHFLLQDEEGGLIPSYEGITKPATSFSVIKTIGGGFRG